MKTDVLSECFFCIVDDMDIIRTPLVCDKCQKPACSANGHIKHLIRNGRVIHICMECFDG